MSIHTLGVLIDNDNYGSTPLGRMRVVVSTKCFLNINSQARPGLQPVHVQTNCTLSLGKVTYLELNVHVQTLARVKAYIPRPTPVTSKFSSYTITPAYRTHAEFSYLNLLSQFKDQPNIEKLLDGTLSELDQCQTDVYEFQDKILNIEKAEGNNLNLCGNILGADRGVAEGDLTYRNKLFAQILINTCDGTLPKILSALTIRYNLSPGPATAPELQVNTLSYNRMEVYVRDFSRIQSEGGSALVDHLTSAGGVAEIVVNDRLTDRFGYFSFSSVDGGVPGGRGWGSYYDGTIGGELVGLLDSDRFTGEGRSSGQEMLVTNKTIAVPTFSNFLSSFGPDVVNRRPDFAKAAL